MSTSAVEWTIALFNCTTDGAVSVSYLVNSMALTEVASIGVSLSAPVYSGNQTSVYLNVPAINSTDNWSVVCIAYLPDETLEVSSPPAYLHVKGLC